jgi:nitrite reductase/ring-hydroxylating ferredoxin subunit
MPTDNVLPMADTPMPDGKWSRGFARRALLLGSAAAGAGAILTACGRGGSKTDGFGTPSTLAPGTTLTPASAVPVGGGTILDAEKTVVTQPVEGTYKAFSSICTHAGCRVTSIENGQIVCPCHQSHFSITDGSVVSGPAPSPLPATAVTRRGATIVTT